MTFIVEILGIIFGLFYVIMGVTKYGLWEGKTILGGFLPTVCGGLLAVLCVLMIISKIKRGDKSAAFDKVAFLPVIAMIAILLVNTLIGLLPACIVVSLLWLRFVEKYSWKTSVIASAILFAFMYAIFSMWLNVPFPKGLIGELL